MWLVDYCVAVALKFEVISTPVGLGRGEMSKMIMIHSSIQFSCFSAEVDAISPLTSGSTVDRPVFLIEMLTND